MRSPCQQGIMYLERHIFPIRMALLIHFIKTGKEEHSHTPPLSKLNVTTSTFIVTIRNLFQIGCADGIFVFQIMFSYSQMMGLFPQY